MLIDFHCHVWRGDLVDQAWAGGAPLLVYLRRARAAGIARTVVFSHHRENADYETGNAEVARIVARFPGRLTGFAFVDARQPARRIFASVDWAVKEFGFCGIKAHGVDGMPSPVICEAARAHRLPLLVDVSGRPSVVEKLASRYPDVSFIIAHLGSLNDDLRAQQRVVGQMADYANVYADTSGVRRFDSIVQAVKRAGAHKLVFGTDGPWLHPGVELQKIRALGLPAEQESLILAGNAARLISTSRAGRAEIGKARWR